MIFVEPQLYNFNELLLTMEQFIRTHIDGSKNSYTSTSLAHDITKDQVTH